MKTKFILSMLGLALVTSSPAQNISDKTQPLSIEPTANSTAPDDSQNDEADLAKKLNNPVAALISVPIQNNWDFGIGPAHAMKYTANIQPVVPLSISED
jgi:hypothetical protein